MRPPAGTSGSFSLHSTSRVGGFAIESGFLQRVRKAPDEPFEFLKLGFPLRYGRIVAGPMLDTHGTR